MGMAGELQRHPRRHALGDVGLMRQQNDRRVIGDLRQRRAEIVDADAPHRPETARREIGQLIAKAGQPERTPVLGQALGVVVVNRNA